MENKNKSRGREKGELSRFKVYCKFFVSSELVVWRCVIRGHVLKDGEGESVKLGLFLLLFGGGGSFFGLQSKNWSFLPH